MSQQSLRDLAQSERAVAEAWLREGKADFHRAHVREAVRLEVLALHTEGRLTALECGRAVLLAESWDGDSVEELLTAAGVLKPGGSAEAVDQ